MSPHKPFAIVVWDDVQSSATTVVTEENLHTHHTPITMKTVGWLLRDDEDGVSIACEEYWEDGIPNWRGHTFILRSLVRSVTPFKLPAPRKSKVSREKAPALSPAPVLPGV